MASRPWEKEAVALAPVFIVGSARSGTSILYRMIQKHPRFKPAMGPHLFESWAMALLPRLTRREDVGEGRLANFLRSIDALSAVVHDIEPLGSRRALVRRLVRKDHSPSRPLWLWKIAGEHHVVRRYFLQAHRSRGAQRLVEKTPTNLRYVTHLGIAFPHARFICIIRHPLDVFSSYRKRYETDPNGSAHMNLTPHEFCLRWEEDTRRAIALAGREDRFLLLKYEQFTTNTEQVVRDVLNHLQESFDEACLLREPDKERPKELSSISETRRAEYAHLWSPVTAESKTWEDHLDAAIAEQVERRLREIMTRAGYEPKVPAVRRG